MQIPTYTRKLQKFAQGCREPFAKSSEKGFSHLMALVQKLPRQYGWRTISVENFAKKFEGALSANQVNTIYWRDTMRNIEAYDLMTVWRGAELLSSTIDQLNQDEVLAPAILARSVIELASVFITNANQIQETVRDVLRKQLANASNGVGRVILSYTLEGIVTKGIQGRRIGNPPDSVKQKNVLTFIQHLDKHPHAKGLLSTYEFLCEVAHPNVLGNARYWGEVIRTNMDGSEILKMERVCQSDLTSQIVEKALWAVGWSAIVIRNGFDLGQNAVHALNNAWPGHGPSS